MRCGCFRSTGSSPSVNTQITSLVIPQLRELMDLYIEAGASNWQIQLTVAMGRAADHPELLLQPYEILELMPLLAELYQEAPDRGLLIQPGNNIGYFGPYERLWRGSGDDRVHWTSCNAGQNTLGIEADGTIKGCPSLPTTPYGGGNIRDLTSKHIWWQTDELSFTRTRTVNDLWGYCRSCYYADVCRAGCTWTTHVLVWSRRQQSLLSSSRVGTFAAGNARTDRADRESAGEAFRSRPLRAGVGRSGRTGAAASAS